MNKLILNSPLNRMDNRKSDKMFVMNRQEGANHDPNMVDIHH